MGRGETPTGQRLSAASKHSHPVVEERADGATLTLFARNPVVSWIVLTVGAFLSLWPMTLVVYGFSISDYGTVLVMAGLTATVFWLTWRVGWRPRPFDISFSQGFLQVGPQRYAYSDIQAFGLARYGGDVVDPVSIGVPRNVTIGTHIYIEVGDRRLPITVGLKDEQAKEALRVFSHLLSKYGSQ